MQNDFRWKDLHVEKKQTSKHVLLIVIAAVGLLSIGSAVAISTSPNFEFGITSDEARAFAVKASKFFPEEDRKANPFVERISKVK